MAEEIEIPRIAPKQEPGKSGDKDYDDSILIPKIAINEEEKGKKGKKRIKMKQFPKIKFPFKKKKLLVIFTSIIIILLVVGIISGLLVYRVYQKARVVESEVKDLIAATQQQDIVTIKEELSQVQSSVLDLKKTYTTVSWMKIIPYFGRFVVDGEHGLNAATIGLEAADIVVETITPYADMIGFAPDSEEAENAQGTTQDRIDYVISTIPEIIPEAEEISTKVGQIKEEVDQIDPERYPETFAGIEVRSRLQKGIELVDMGAQIVMNGIPLLKQAQYLLGIEEPRTYLVLFQNDKELRPTGGFITAYSIAEVEKAKFKPVSSNDIYNLDNLYTPTVPASEPIKKYLKGPYLISSNYRLRDMNWSPDFYQSMDLFLKEVEKVGIKDVDGVIAVDTQLLVNILEVVGVIQVPGYGGYSNDIVEVCNCPQVVYELESFADLEGPIVWSENEPGKIVFAPPNYDNRKKIIGPMMNTILAEVMGQPDEKMPALFKAIMTSLLEKHVLFYLIDGEAQKSVESFRVAGRLEQYSDDYLFINDANLGGRKSNLYVTQEVSQKIDVERDGSVTKEVTITYKNPMRHDGWLNSVLPNYVRVYVPKGSELLNVDGLEEKEEPYEEFGKSVFAGFFQLRPQGVSRVTLRYKLPFKVEGKEYKIYIQKQPGTNAPLYTIEIGKYEEELFLKTDKELKFKI